MIRKRRSGRYRLYSRKRDPLPRGGEMWARSRRTRPPSVMSVPCTTSSTRRMRGRSMARARKGDSGRASAGRRWVRRVQETSNAMDLPRGNLHSVTAGRRPRPEEGRDPQPAHEGPHRVSVRDVHAQLLNRGGRGLSGADRMRLQAAKRELRKAFGRPADGTRRRSA